VKLRDTILWRYHEKVIVVVLHYINNEGIAFATALTMTPNLQRCKYCKLGFEIFEMWHAHNQCLYLSMKVLLVFKKRLIHLWWIKACVWNDIR
jgi:hypothetical protein